MMPWEVPGESLLWLEIYAGAGLLAALSLWVFFHKIPISLFALFVTGTVMAVASFRPPDYNSDTLNYYSYVTSLSMVRGSAVFILTKLEPVHSGLIFITGDFRWWLIAENAIQMFGLWISYKNRRNDYSFVVLCAFLLTLNTSSLRYCSALIFFFYFISRYAAITISRAIIWTGILSTFHITMLLSGALSVKRRIVVAAIALLFFAIFFQSSILGNRVGGDLTEASKGVKSFVVAAGTILYLLTQARKGGRDYLWLYLATSCATLLISWSILPTFNRYQLLLTLIVFAREWPIREKAGHRSFIDRTFVLLVSGGIILPYIVTLPKLYFSGLW